MSLQPGRINACAQAMIQTMRVDKRKRGRLTEERVLGGDPTYDRPEVVGNLVLSAQNAVTSR